MINKKNKKTFLLLFTIFILLTFFYFLFNKNPILEKLTNTITPVIKLQNSDSNSDNYYSDSETYSDIYNSIKSYCGSSDPYDSDGIQITEKTISGCEKNNELTPQTNDPDCMYTDKLAIDYDTQNYTYLTPG